MDPLILKNYEIASSYIQSKFLFDFVKELFTNRSFFKKFKYDGFTDIKKYNIRIPILDKNSPFGIYKTYVDIETDKILIDDVEDYGLGYSALVSDMSINIIKIKYQKLDIDDYWKLFCYLKDNN